MKKVIVVVVMLGVLGLAFPLSNLVVGAPSGTALTKAAAGNAELEQVAGLLEAKCANCHTAEPVLPFYAKFPVAKGMIQKDMEEGRRWFDMVEGLAPGDKLPPTEPALAMIEHVLNEESMPPGKYLALHWDGGLSGKNLAMLNVWIKRVRIKHHGPAEFSDEVKAGAVHPIPTKVTFDAAKAKLGDKLYHDKRLSGDDTVSCASCHALAKGGTDQLPVSVGIRDQKGGINAPTTFNALWQVKQFWDGRAADLQEQAGGPPLNPIEMGGKWEDIVKKLNEDEAFAAAFSEQYPEGFSEKTITAAIAEFERTLLPRARRSTRFCSATKARCRPTPRRAGPCFRSTPARPATPVGCWAAARSSSWAGPKTTSPRGAPRSPRKTWAGSA